MQLGLQIWSWAKYPTKTKIWIQTFKEICIAYGTIVTNFPEKCWKLSSVKAICLPFSLAS